LPKTNAFLIFDRILRDMLEQTLPERTYEPIDELTLPLADATPSVRVTLERPGRPDREAVDVSFVSAGARGVTLPALLQRGIYKLRGIEAPLMASAADSSPGWEVALAVNGPAEESDLTVVSASKLDQLGELGGVRLAAPGESLRASTTASGRQFWWWLMIGVLLLLLAEMFVSAFTWAPRQRTRALFTT
jgi:hypothetical protein